MDTDKGTHLINLLLKFIIPATATVEARNQERGIEFKCIPAIRTNIIMLKNCEFISKTE